MSATAPRRHLTIHGTLFRRDDNRVFQWRGVSSFRLLEQLAAGRPDDVERYLAWAAGERLTVVRVLAMAKHLFQLEPERGRAHLEDLLRRAAAHDLYVEIVALADTAEYPVPVDEQVRSVGDIAGRHANAIVEIANEPYHATQRSAVRDPSVLNTLLALVPEPVPTAVGAWQEPREAAAGDYVTFHFPRSVASDGWGHVRDLVLGREMLRQFGKPVVNDEPIGAGPVFQPGRRDDNAERFRAAALLTRMVGMGATFHYEGGLQSTVPEGRVLEIFRAWQEAWVRLPGDVEEKGTFRVTGEPGAASQRVDGIAMGAWEVQRGDEAWVLVADTRGVVRLQWAEGWRQVEVVTWPGLMWLRAARTSP